MNRTHPSFRILSLDGGGVRGILSAQILSNAENYLNRIRNENIPIGRRFDLITGTSTGGLIALALALNHPAFEVLEFYRSLIPRVFGRSSKRNYISRLIRPKYKNNELAIACDNFFEAATLKDVSTDVCITSVSLQNARLRLHKSDYSSRYSERASALVRDIAMSTSAAPTYFRSHSSKHSADLIDGGVCANNPAMIGLVETSQFERNSLRQPEVPITDSRDSLKNVTLLSIGTGEPGCLPYDMNKLKNAGLAQWAKPISEVLINCQSDAVHHQVKFLLGPRYCRINPPLNFRMELDDLKLVDELKNLADLDLATENFLKTHFVD